WVEALLRQPLFIVELGIRAPGRMQQPLDGIDAQPHGLADVTDSALAALLRYRGYDGGPVTAIFLIHILDHLLPPFVLKVYVDIGRLVTRGRKKPLEQQIEFRRIDRSDAEAETHR